MSSPDLARPLIASGWTVELHTDRFPRQGEKPDYEWIPIVTSSGLTIVTSDKKLRGWMAEGGLVRPAIEECGARIFTLKAMAAEEQAKLIHESRHAIRRFVVRHRRTFLIARIHGDGNRRGEVQLLSEMKGTATERKFGRVVRSTSDA